MSELIERLRRLSTEQRASLVALLQQRDASRNSVNTRLVAYLVPEPDTTINTNALLGALGEHLPDYMIPVNIVVLDAMPLTPNGKLDRAALPHFQSVSSHDEESSFIEPRTEVEKEIAQIWAALLGFDLIGIHDNFFELGGHSLLVTQAIARMRDRFQVAISVTSFFEHPSIAQLAEQIEALQLVINNTRDVVPTGERDEMEF
jgi:acyl carrier protein